MASDIVTVDPAAESNGKYKPGKPVVAVITPSLGLGGAEQWLRCLVTYCHEINWVVGVLGIEHWHPIVGDAVINYAWKVNSLRGVPGEITEHVTVSEVILATVHNADAVIVWGGGCYWPLPTRAPVIFVGHGTCQWTLKAAAEAKAGGATHFAAVSTKSAEVVSAVHPDVRAILNGVDTARLCVPEDRHAIRQTWAPSAYDYAKYVGYVGRLGNEKNIDSIIFAVAALPYHYHLVLIGCTGWKAHTILELARTLLRDRLIEVPATDNLGIQYGGLDCLVQVSPREGHSLVMCEAMLTRTPIISNMTGALPELSEMAGICLVEKVPDEPTTQEIACAIRRVCNTPPVDRIDRAEQFALRYLTQDAMCRHWEEYLYDIIGENPLMDAGMEFAEKDRVLVIGINHPACGLLATVKLTDRHGQVWAQVDDYNDRKYVPFQPEELERYSPSESDHANLRSDTPTT